jgi:hypothetical protein
MKTGTSYVQGLLERDRESLAAEGVLVPVDVNRAVHDVLDRRGTRSLGSVTGTWDALLKSVREWRGDRVLVSMEFLGLATAPQIKKIIDSLAPSPVRVVITARDLGRAVPSAWQQTTKNQQRATWQEFLDAITNESEGSSPALQFWRHHDVASMARRWTAVVGADAVTVVTVPPSGSPPEELWQRFCAAVGLDVADHAPDGKERRNASLGHVEAEVLRRLNVALAGRIPQPDYRRLVTGVISRQVLRRGHGVTQPPVVPASVHAWAVERSAGVVADLRSLGVRVVGDLDDLRPEPLSTEPASEPSDAEVAAIAVRVAAALLPRVAELSARPRGQPSRSDRKASK